MSAQLDEVGRWRIEHESRRVRECVVRDRTGSYGFSVQVCRNERREQASEPRQKKVRVLVRQSVRSDDGVSENILEAGVGPTQAGVRMKLCGRGGVESGESEEGESEGC